MRRSIRLRLQVWYGFVLLAVVAAFAGILYYRAHTGRMRELDNALEAAAQYLDANLRRFPPYELLEDLPDRPPLPPPGPPQGQNDDGPVRRPPPRPLREPDDARPDRPPPPSRFEERADDRSPPHPPGPPNLERLLGDLTLPHPPGPPRPDSPEDRAYFAVWRADGSLIKAVGLPEGLEPADVGAPSGPRLKWQNWSGHRELTMLGPMRSRILVGKSVRREHDELWAFAWLLGGAGLAVLAVGLVGGWWVSARILRPVAAIATSASAISETNLSERIDADDVEVELADLAHVLNATFARLESAFERQARFTADASHELRTPLAVLRSQAELALSRPRAAEDYQQALTACLRASERMGTLVDGLLMLARADAGKLEVARAPVDLRRVVQETVTLLEPLATAKGLHLTTELAPLIVLGDAGRLAQVVTNLVSNAIQYNHAGGSVQVRLGVDQGSAVLSVEDTGQGIPAEDRPHIFERFYRVDKARSRASGGHGLGLAICKSVVESHGGTIDFESEQGKGSTFWVRLPCAGA